MEILSILQHLWQQVLEISWLQWLGVSAGVTQVMLSKNNKVSNYLFGIISVIVTMIVLYEAKLYAEIALNMYYLIMSIYGWWYWISNKDAAQKPITSCSGKDWGIVVLIVGTAFAIFYYFLTRHTDSDVPLWDAWVSATAWAGMWLLARRKLENWILLNISNLFAIPLLYHKGLLLYAILTFYLFTVAFFGYFNWKKMMKNHALYTVKGDQKI
ncbi:nicotinamide riboside transporter PnuC [Sphingobacterium spiritivorum]|uniref:nicotinamide riboside transporter PnuC n=1 Tax=Sphingobacterium spiritivorum TaxID=258 RepID=UPI003DA357D6